jgi:ribosomal protein S18 acetylase RimI-like enzyme
VIGYTTEASTLTPDDLDGFFQGWRPSAPSMGFKLSALRSAHGVELARDGGTLVGFVTAISDGVSWAYVPLLEVLPAYQRRGIGTELMRRILARYGHLYAFDLNCDDDLVPFYERLGMTRLNGMVIRNRGALEETVTTREPLA